MNLKNILSLLPQLLRSVRYGERPRPMRDWLVIVTATLTLLVASAGWSYWVFMQASTSAQKTMASLPATPMQTTTIETVKTIFDKRASERQRYVSEYRFVDPSK